VGCSPHHPELFTHWNSSCDFILLYFFIIFFFLVIKPGPSMLGMLGSLFTKDFCFVAWHQWLTPVIVATQESEISSIAVQSQSRQIVQETLSQKKKNHKKGLVLWLKM
jgi:hypothetical protein